MHTSAQRTPTNPTIIKGISHNKANVINQMGMEIFRHDAALNGGMKFELLLKRLITMTQPVVMEKITPTPKINSKN